MLFLSLGTVLAITHVSFITITSAIPTTLSPRAQESVTTDNDPTRPGTLHCFTSGTWLPVYLLLPSPPAINDPITTACTPPSNNNGVGYFSFSFTPHPNGTYDHQYARAALPCDPSQEIAPGKCVDSRPEYPRFDMQLMGPTHANSSECIWALSHILDACPKGVHQDSQGGWWQFKDDGSTFGLDPTVDHEMKPGE
ncbi:MAG: hypothetical protein Q9220_005692 [cf. Caloplaca sp. 1 TL-2023]